MKKNVILMIILVCSLSCNDETKTIVNEVKDVELLNNNILKFKDQATFDNYVAQKSNAPKGFYSIYKRFDEAMSEAEAYYSREGGYLEFKEKYSELYFPEQGTDYAAYLPVSNEAEAKFLNLNCEVMIGDELKNFRDVDTYAKLQAIGKAVPEFIQQAASDPEGTVQTRTIYNDNNGMHKVFSSTKGRAIWVNLHLKNYPLPYNEYYLQAEICFRKRQFGIEFNYHAGTSFYVNSRFFGSRNEAWSSHDYTYCKVRTYYGPDGKWWHEGVKHDILFTHSSWPGDIFSIHIDLPAGRI